MNATLEPSDNIYVQQLPGRWNERDLQELFGHYGTVQECRVIRRNNNSGTVRAMVRMHSITEATRAIAALNGTVPSCVDGRANHLPLLLCFADSPVEKARKSEQKQLQAALLRRFSDLPQTWSPPKDVLCGELDTLCQAYLPLNAVPCAVNDHLSTGKAQTSLLDCATVIHQSERQGTLSIGDLFSYLFPAPPTNDKVLMPSDDSTPSVTGLVNRGPRPPTPPQKSVPHTKPALSALHYQCSTVCIKNAPADASDLWVYRRFAPFGPIFSVEVPDKKASNGCHAVGFVHYTTVEGAVAAIQAMNGCKVGDQILHVSLQTWT